MYFVCSKKETMQYSLNKWTGFVSLKVPASLTKDFWLPITVPTKKSLNALVLVGSMTSTKSLLTTAAWNPTKYAFNEAH